MKKKVLFFLPSMTGGAERMTVNIAKMLPLDRFEVKFVIVHRNLGTIIDFIPKGYEIIHIPIHNIWCFATLRMYRIIKKEKPHVVFSSLVYINYRLAFAAKIADVKCIIRDSIGLDEIESHPYVYFFTKRMYPFANLIIAQQEEMRNEILKRISISPKRVITLHNPIDTNLIINKIDVPSPYREEKFIKYVCVARFKHSKGQDLLVEAFAKVKKQLYNAELFLIGEYCKERSYDALVTELVNMHNLQDSVHFVGFDNNPYKWIKNATVYVMPSRMEGLPNSLIEAMYLGLPVVATRCIPVIDRIVEDGYNGYIVETDNGETLADAMIKALNLKNFQMTYKSATKDDFIRLFE